MSAFFSLHLRTFTLGVTSLAFAGSCFAYQAAAEKPAPAEKPGPIDLNSKRPIQEGKSPRAQAYYHYTLGHMYEEMASAYGNRAEYVNKAIENYRQAMKDDPTATFLVEDIADLYRQAGRLAGSGGRS